MFDVKDVLVGIRLRDQAVVIDVKRRRYFARSHCWHATKLQSPECACANLEHES